MSEYICNTEDKCGMCEVYKTAKPIVRCRDCEFGAYNGEECMRIDEMDGSLWFPVEPDGFCAWGARKNG